MDFYAGDMAACQFPDCSRVYPGRVALYADQHGKGHALLPKTGCIRGTEFFSEIFVRCIRQEVEQALRENAFHPSHHLLSVELISEYFARIFWFVTEKWLNYAEEVSALEVMEVYEILFSDSAEKLLGHKVEG